jgi:cell division septation protein DedD
MADEGFREIQLNGKQLVFLFMTAAVVLVVTFLCGVLVGRGVRAQKEATVAGDGLAPGAVAATDPTAGVAAVQPGAALAPAQPPATPPPTPPEEELSYYSRLESEGQPGEPAKPGPPAPAVKDPKAPRTGGDANTKAAPAGAAASPAATTANGEPPGPGLALRVAAYKDRTQADALAARLSGKGYGTFVVQLPSAAGPGLFSVRVGKFKTRKEADAVKRRLEKEEQLKPSLITR